MRRLFIPVFAISRATSVGHAEILLNIEGEGVRVHAGQGFQITHTATIVRPGDMIMIRRDASGKAELVYEDRCAISIRPGDIRRVAKSSPCSFMAREAAPLDRAAPEETQTAAITENPAAGNLAMGAIGAGVVAGSLATGVYAATRPVNVAPPLPLFPTPCASAGC